MEHTNAAGQDQQARWMEKYGPSLDREAPIEFEGKSFVLAGLRLLEEETGLHLAQEITNRGGMIRTDVSGRTDFLVTDPRWGHESKLRAALVQRAKGKAIRIVLGSDLLTALGGESTLYGEIPEEAAQTAHPTIPEETAEVVPPAAPESLPEDAQSETPEEDTTLSLRTRYDELTAQREQQQAIIAASKGWFGEAARRRKAAQAQLEELEQTISREFPNGRP